MALKFLNKKGWHTGSLRNIENVWKAEQKHEAEQKKLEELRKQIQEERERSEFRLLQEQAGLVPRQERLDFLYDSGLAVGKGSSDGFRELEDFPKSLPETAPSTSAKQQQQAFVPGALFEEKAQSANDAWRKLHSDPLLLIRQREQEALARVKNNPIQMDMIRKSVEANKHDKKISDRKEQKKLHHKEKKRRKHSSPKRHLDSESVAVLGGEDRRNSSNHKSSNYDEHLYKAASNSEELREGDIQRNRNSGKDLTDIEQPPRGMLDSTTEQSKAKDRMKRAHYRSKHYDGQMNSKSARKGSEDRSFRQARRHNSPDRAPLHESHPKRRNVPLKLSEEERAARLQEMQMDAKLHEEQRWKRLKRADEDDARETTHARMSSGRNFLDAAQKSIYGAEKGGSSTIEESVRRRTHYLQGRSDVGEGNAFRR